MTFDYRLAEGRDGAQSGNRKRVAISTICNSEHRRFVRTADLRLNRGIADNNKTVVQEFPVFPNCFSLPLPCYLKV